MKLLDSSANNWQTFKLPAAKKKRSRDVATTMFRKPRAAANLTRDQCGVALYWWTTRYSGCFGVVARFVCLHSF